MNQYDKRIFLETYKSFVDNASLIDGFVVGQKEDVEYDITELANAYCDARRRNDEDAKNKYMSALMVRYWHMVSYMYNKSLGSISSIYDVIEWIYDGIERACSYEAWNDPEKSISKDPKGAEKCINQSITSSRVRFYDFTNRKSRSMMFSKLSLDDEIDEKGNSRYNTVYEDDGVDMSFEIVDEIKKLAHSGKLVEALMLDAIVFQNTFVVTSKGNGFVKNYDEDGNEVDSKERRKSFRFSKSLMYDHLKNMDDDFVSYFCGRYGVDESSIDVVKKKLTGRSSSNTLSKGMDFLKNDEVVKHYAR